MSLVSGCAILEDPVYCGGSGTCCTLVDSRNDARKSFCVDDQSQCVAQNDHQSVKYPDYPGHGKCGYKRGASLEKKRFYANARDERLMNALASLLAESSIQVVSSRNAVDCDFVCTTDSPLCNPMAGSYSHGLELARLEGLVEGAGERVAKSEIMEVFRQSTDLCGRGDVIINDERFSNTGSTNTCVARTRLQSGTDKNTETVEMEISLPREVSGTLVKDDLGIKASFDPGKEPVILYDDNPDSLFSGAISSISSRTGAVTAEIGGECLVVDDRAI